MLACIFPRCPGHDGRQLDEIQHSLQHMAAAVADIQRDLRTVITKEGTIMTDVTTLAADFDKYKGDVTDAFARLQATIDAAGGIPADVQAQIDALDTAINGADAEAVAEDPAPAAPTA
jgi:uncharacterized protein YoxC